MGRRRELEMWLQKKDVWKLTKKKRERLKYVHIRAKREVNEEFERNMSQDVYGNRKLYWKELSKLNGGKVESCSRIKGRNWRLALREDEV